MLQFGISTDGVCSFCSLQETHDQLFFECVYTKSVWNMVLQWLRVQRTIGSWDTEVTWLSLVTKGRGVMAQLLKAAVAETIYGIWQYRNEITSQNKPKNCQIGPRIIRNICDRCVQFRQLHGPCQCLFCGQTIR